jgi:imidazole glycerol-phosphate synthase subunit HisH
MSTLAIIDYGMCNLDSVGRAVERQGGDFVITADPADLGQADGIILPGVGAFPDAMANLHQRGLVEALRGRVLSDRVPFLGICLGMQLMASRGLEGGDTPGLDLVPGVVRRLEPDRPDVRVPHVGWNEVAQAEPCALWDQIPDLTNFYFVHSYHFDCPEDFVAGRTDYCGGFVSVIHRDHIFGVQFHPEKSLDLGLRLLANFIALC